MTWIKKKIICKLIVIKPTINWTSILYKKVSLKGEGVMNIYTSDN